MTSLLVLGSRGFLGAHVVAAARAHPGVTSLLTPGRADLDLTGDPGSVREVLEGLGPDAVLVCTGRLDGTVTELTAAHAVVTATLVEAVTALPRPPRLIRLGSAGEYGPVPVGRPVGEDDQTRPVTAYGASHLAATHLLGSAVRQGLVTGTTLRVFNPVGRGAHGGNLAAQVADRLVAAVRDRLPEIWTAPLDPHRDFVDARDVGRAAVLAALTDRSLPPVLNIGSGLARPVGDVVELLVELAGFTGTVREDGAPPGRSAGVSWIQAEIGLAREVLSWVPEHDLLSSLADLWAGLDHPRAASLAASR